MKKITTVFAFLFSVMAFAQNINDYKYVLVPSQYSINKEPNAYNLNAMTKSLLEKYGFVVYMDSDQMPDEVLNFNCNKLYADVLESNTMTSTKLTIILKDCKNNVIFKSAEGKSREKEWKAGYNEAFRNAAKSFDALRYKYNGSTIGVQTETVKTTNDGSSIKKEVVSGSSTPMPQGKVLFAQPIANGFQLVDSSPKVVLKIYKTNSPTVFIAEKETFKGVLRQENGNWFFEYYSDNKLISESILVKF